MGYKYFVNGQEIKSFEELPTGMNIVVDRRYIYQESDLENSIFGEFSAYDVMSIVRHAMKLEKKIFAIKMVRKFTDWGLRESKEFVENIEY